MVGTCDAPARGEQFVRQRSFSGKSSSSWPTPKDSGISRRCDRARLGDLDQTRAKTGDMLVDVDAAHRAAVGQVSCTRVMASLFRRPARRSSRINGLGVTVGTSLPISATSQTLTLLVQSAIAVATVSLGACGS